MIQDVLKLLADDSVVGQVDIGGEDEIAGDGASSLGVVLDVPDAGSRVLWRACEGGVDTELQIVSGLCSRRMEE